MPTPGPNGAAADVTTTATNILDMSFKPKGATTLKLIAETGNTGNILVNIPGLHGTDAELGASAWAQLNPGESELFRLGNAELLTCNVKSDSGTQSIRWAVVAVT